MHTLLPCFLLGRIELAQALGNFGLALGGIGEALGQLVAHEIVERVFLFRLFDGLVGDTGNFVLLLTQAGQFRLCLLLALL